MLRDPVWQFGSVVVTAIGIIATILIYRATTGHKELSYTILSSAPVTTVNPAIRNRVQVTIDGVPIPDATLVSINIANTGSLPIPNSDYESPLLITFQGNIKVLNADAINKHPSDLPVKFTLQPDSISIEPLLLNNGDSTTLNILLDNAPSDISLTSRIIGVNSIHKVLTTANGQTPPDLGHVLLIVVPIVTLIILLALIAILYIKHHPVPELQYKLISSTHDSTEVELTNTDDSRTIFVNIHEKVIVDFGREGHVTDIESSGTNGNHPTVSTDNHHRAVIISLVLEPNKSITLLITGTGLEHVSMWVFRNAQSRSWTLTRGTTSAL